MARSNFSQDVSWLAICGLPGDTFIHLEQADETVELMGRLFRSDHDSNKYSFFLLIPGVALGFRFFRNGHQGSRTQRLRRKMEFFFRFCFLRFNVLTKASKTALILARAAATRLGVSWKLANTFRETQQYGPRTDFGLGPR